MSPGQVGRWRASARGVLAVLGPFNFPGHLAHGHVVPALATGNCVVVKPSEKTPATGQVYAELLQRAAFPPGVANLVQGEATVGARLAAHPRLDGVLFTGSYAAGRRILEATLDQPWKLVALEMGGKNGVLVCADADLDAAANAIAFGACVTSGQRCSATSRVFAARAVADALCERLARLVPRHRDRPLERPGRVHGPGDLGRRARATRAGVGVGRGRGRRRRSSRAARARVRAPATTCGPACTGCRARSRAGRAATRARSTSCPTRS